VTDEALLAKKLAFIETCVRELRSLARIDLLEHDVREARFVEHTLQLAIQAALDVASHVVSDRRLGEPETNQQLFVLLAAWAVGFAAGRTTKQVFPRAAPSLPARLYLAYT